MTLLCINLVNLTRSAQGGSALPKTGLPPGIDPRHAFHMTTEDLHWLAGLLEGEGCFMFPVPSNPTGAAISLEMIDEDVVVRAARLVGGIAVNRRVRGSNQPSYRFILRGPRAVELMKTLSPLLGIRRREKVERILAHMLQLPPKGLRGGKRG